MSASLPGTVPADVEMNYRGRTSRPISARVDLGALQHNYRQAKQLAGSARAWAVIKADAYGHGQLQAARALADAADGFALLEVETAQSLREAGIAQPMLLLEGFFQAEDVSRLAQFDLTPAIHCREQLEMLAAAHQRPRSAYIKLNTGMNRLGFRPEDAGLVRTRLEALGIGDLTLMTHFADADGPVGIAEPLKRFQQVAQTMGLPVSLANSAALIRYPEARGDWVRPGIMLYGGCPFADQKAANLGLQPVMTLESRLIAIQGLEAGASVGYGARFSASHPMRIGIVACGYADGYPRHAPDGTPIAVAGQATRIVGRVSMDMLMVDLSPVHQAQVGSPVTLWGQGEGGAVDADAVAAAAGTISYEMFCALAARVPVRWI